MILGKEQIKMLSPIRTKNILTIVKFRDSLITTATYEEVLFAFSDNLIPLDITTWK